MDATLRPDRLQRLISEVRGAAADFRGFSIAIRAAGGCAALESVSEGLLKVHEALESCGSWGEMSGLLSDAARRLEDGFWRMQETRLAPGEAMLVHTTLEGVYGRLPVSAVGELAASANELLAIVASMKVGEIGDAVLFQMFHVKGAYRDCIPESDAEKSMPGIGLLGPSYCRSRSASLLRVASS